MRVQLDMLIELTMMTRSSDKTLQQIDYHWMFDIRYSNKVWGKRRFLF